MDDGAGGGEAARGGGGLAKTTTATTTLQLGALLGLWHLFSIYNKQVLKVFPFPMNITMVQYAVGTVIALIMWTTGILQRPKLSGAQVAAILPLAIVHTLCDLFTNMSPGKVAVSFTHVSKSNMDPNLFLSVLLSRKVILGQFLIPWIVLCLVQIATAFQSRKVLRGSLGAINLFSVITLMSFFLLAPVTLLTEGVKVSPAVLQSAGLNLKQIYTRSLIAAFCFHAYQQVSYMILARVSPVTHSVGNCVMRVVVIVTSVLFFRTPVSPVNSLGTGVALAGVFLYSQLKRLRPNAKAA